MSLEDGRRMFTEFKERVYRSKNLLKEIWAAQAKFNAPTVVHCTVYWKEFIAGGKLEVQVRPAQHSPFWRKVTEKNFDQLDFSKVLFAVEFVRSNVKVYQTIGTLPSNQVSMDDGPIVEKYEVIRANNKLLCGTCSKETRMICPNCRSMAYCGEGCMKIDWPTHRLICPKMARLFNPKPEKSETKAPE